MQVNNEKKVSGAIGQEMEEEIKVQEVYQVSWGRISSFLARGREYHGCREEYNVEIGKEEAI